MDGSKGIAMFVWQPCSAGKSVYNLLINVSQQQKFEIQTFSDYLNIIDWKHFGINFKYENMKPLFLSWKYSAVVNCFSSEISIWSEQMK